MKPFPSVPTTPSPANPPNPVDPVNAVLRICLQCSADQHQRLLSLQAEFSRACNLVSQLARANRCWNRVALHHLSYRLLRQTFPNLGSQMACNAVYSVCRACRWAYQHPDSPLRLAAEPNAPMALIFFLPNAPVYFDRHTLNLSQSELSMYTLDGRIHFKLTVSTKDQQRFLTEKLKEVALTRSPQGFELVFWFESNQTHGATATKAPTAPELEPNSLAIGPLISQPPYLKTLTQAQPAELPLP
jgi:hypothetical protein